MTPSLGDNQRENLLITIGQRTLLSPADVFTPRQTGIGGDNRAINPPTGPNTNTQNHQFQSQSVKVIPVIPNPYGDDYRKISF